MSEIEGMMQLKVVDSNEIHKFRRMVEAYWQDVMPLADVIQDKPRRDAYFLRSFSWRDGDQPPIWAILNGYIIGFIHYTFDANSNCATIEDFYVAPHQRQKGYGTLMIQTLHKSLDALGVELIELNVRRDNPQARAFWEAQGFRIASYRMRQYRNPQTGHAFVGALSTDFITE